MSLLLDGAFELAEQSLNWALTQSLRPVVWPQSALNRTICFDIAEFPQPIYLFIGANHIQLLQHSDHVDAKLKTNLASLRALDASSLTHAIKHDQIEIEGDLNLLQTLANNLLNLQFDWLAPLANTIGDVPSQIIAQVGTLKLGKVKQCAKQAQTQIESLITTELDLLPRRTEFSDFANKINKLQQQAAALELRISTHLSKKA